MNAENKSAIAPTTHRRESVAGFCAELAVRQREGGQPEEVVHAAKRCIIDWFAASLPGASGRPALALETGLADELGHGDAWTLSGCRAPMRVAALINGTASHTVEFDDIFAPAIYHPGSPVIAAAIASAQGKRRSGRALINAVIAGYEVSTRIGAVMGAEHYRYWHTTGTIGTIGATAAVGVLHGLDRTQMAHAISASVTLAAGLQAAFRGDSELKPLHAGHAADAGHMAVALCHSGVPSSRDMFESDVGFGRAMSRDVDWTETFAAPDHFNITRMTVKNHGCCGHIFPALDGALTLQAEHGFAAEDVDRIEVGGYSATVNVTGNYSADTAGAAKFCLPFILASGLVHGSIRLDAYSEARLADRVVRNLMPRITVSLDPEVDALFPRQRAAQVRITLKDGRVFERFQPHRIGDPDLPLSDRQLEAKFMELAVMTMPEPSARELLSALWSLDRAREVTGLQKIITG